MNINPPEGYCPVCFARLPERKRTGRPRIYCTDECKRTAWLLATLESELGALAARGRGLQDDRPEAHPAALAQLRQAVWAAGNTLPTTRDRRPGTRYWSLGLDCGHFKLEKARTRRREGVQVQDPPPARTECPHCRHKVQVVAQRLEVARATPLPWRER